MQSDPRESEPSRRAAAPVVAVMLMGVSGCGKTEIGRRLAAALGWDFHDGDEFHPPENVERMRRGMPLADEHRRPWLAAIAAHLSTALDAGRGSVYACSALARRYREQLGLPRSGVLLVHLSGDVDTIRRRLEARRGHFMPASLLESQLAALEPPGADEDPLVIDVGAAPETIVRRIIATLPSR
jgi:gluconokinase